MTAQAARPTPWPWIAQKHGVMVGGEEREFTNGKARAQIAMFTFRQESGSPELERDANAALAVEAREQLHLTGLTPRQLAEQRAELLAALIAMNRLAEGPRGGVTIAMKQGAVDSARAAIAKAGAQPPPVA